jgi:hypothetical protein
VASLPPQRPDAGTWAGIDVGAKGVKPVAMTFVRTAGGEWDFTADTSLESKNTDLGTPAAGDSGFDPGRLKATAEAVKELDEKLRKKYALPPERVKVVVSSGVFTRLRDPAVAAAARKELGAALTAATGRAPDFIDGRQEAELAARGTIAHPPGPAARWWTSAAGTSRSAGTRARSSSTAPSTRARRRCTTRPPRTPATTR